MCLFADDLCLYFAVIHLLPESFVCVVPHDAKTLINYIKKKVKMVVCCKYLHCN